jgi:hypothetical protein
MARELRGATNASQISISGEAVVVGATVCVGATGAVLWGVVPGICRDPMRLLPNAGYPTEF